MLLFVFLNVEQAATVTVFIPHTVTETNLVKLGETELIAAHDHGLAYLVKLP